ncbi:siderophore-interacting protein [Streptomyces sp. NPDC003247]|uniref:siderophore-interacting protein n=1 Tax=Streptomyces sp. NPDC003247 TaxID=3364677 RepID=UPI0036A3A9F1
MTSPQPSGAPRGRGGRQRLPRRRVTVAEVTSVTPRLVRVRAEGDLTGWTADGPGAHLKVFVPGPDGGNVMRTYTVRHVDADGGELTVEFGLHADGPATRWASAAAPGDTLEISGQARGGFFPRSGTSRIVILGDHCALPAIATILESLPDGTRAEAVIEVVGLEDRIDLDGPVGADITWTAESGRPGGQLVAFAKALTFSDEPTEVWVGCEAGVMREIRRHLLASGAQLPTAPPVAGAPVLHTRAYWKLNTANHSDHDTGEDD